MRGNRNRCQKCGSRDCNDLTHVDWGTKPAPLGQGNVQRSLGGLGSSGTAFGNRDRKDSAYEADKQRQEDEGNTHLVRYLTKQDVKNGALRAMGNAVDHSQKEGDLVRVILKKKFKDSFPEFKRH